MLLPCPFCGSDTVRIELGGGPGNTYITYVMCEGCRHVERMPLPAPPQSKRAAALSDLAALDGETI